MSWDRLAGEWARRYLGPRLFQCRWCGAEYEHDGGYEHDVYKCPKRKGAGHGR